MSGMSAFANADMENPYPTQKLALVDFEDYDSPEQILDGDIERVADANVATSRVKARQFAFQPGFDEPDKALHKPLLDIDMPARLIPSSTPGHHHLFIECEMTWSQYGKLLLALAEAGILEMGYVRASLQRGYTAVRLPWIKKGDMSEQAQGQQGIYAEL